jgi:hypothetical protein
VGGQHHAPATLLQGKTWYLLYRRLGGPQDWSGEMQKILLSLGFDPWTVQPIACHYTNCASQSTFNDILLITVYITSGTEYINIYVTSKSHNISINQLFIIHYSNPYKV